MNFRNLLIHVQQASGLALGAVRRVIWSEQTDGHEIDAMEMEARVLYSASPLAGLVPAEDAGGDTATHDASLDSLTEISQTIEFSTPEATTTALTDIPGFEFVDSLMVDDGVIATEPGTHELVIIDPSADDFQQLLDDLNRESDRDRQFQVLLLDAERDGVEQITEALQQTGSLDAIHIVSHGQNGAVQLGNSWLNAQNLNAYASQITNWQDALNSDADLLFYGCDLAADETGRTFTDACARCPHGAAHQFGKSF